MGWLWSTSTTAAASSSNGNAASSNGNAASSSQPEPQLPRASQQPSPSPTRDELADKELQSFFQELEADARPSSTKYSRIPKEPPPPNASQSPASKEPLSEQLLPTTMSCREAFDSAFYCNSLGGQFNNLYRYGTVGSCSENWDDFWFCMRTRGYGNQAKQEAIRARYREKETRKYRRGEFGTSSEDVWKSRDQKVELGEAFRTPFPEFKGTDEEWNRMEREQRAKFLSNLKS